MWGSCFSLFFGLIRNEIVPLVTHFLTSLQVDLLIEKSGNFQKLASVGCMQFCCWNSAIVGILIVIDCSEFLFLLLDC